MDIKQLKKKQKKQEKILHKKLKIDNLYPN